MKYSATSTPDSCGQLQKTAIHLHRNKSWPSAATSTFAASQRMADFGIRNWLIDRPKWRRFTAEAR